MDTTWFAVDADGRVARFESGEAGAVPNGAAIGGGEMRSDVDTERLERLLVARTWARELAQDATRVENEHEPHGPEPAIVAFAVDGSYRGGEPRIDDLLAAFDPVVLQDSPFRIVATNAKLSPEVLETLRRHPSVLRFEYLDSLYENEELRARELYVFGNSDYDVPGAYVRRTEPEAPVTLDDLPRDLREPLAALRFPIRFPDAPALQLADYMRDADATIWGDAPLDGRTPERAADVEAPQSTSRVATLVVVVLALIVLAALLRAR